MLKRYINTKNHTLLFSYLSITFLLMLSDAILSFIAPTYINNVVKNEFYLGLILSLSSVVGLLFDFIAGYKLKNKKSGYFLRITILNSLLFALTFLWFRNLLIPLILGMVVWGIYYESLAFSDFNFIKEKIEKVNYSRVWEILSVLGATAYLIGPIIVILMQNAFFSEWVVETSLILILSSYLIFKINRFDKTSKMPSESRTYEITKFSIFKEFVIWKIIIKRIWLFVVFTIVFYGVDAFIWTIGILFSQDLAQNHVLGNFLVPIYLLPYLLFSALSHNISKRIGKKRTSFVTAAIAGAILFLIGFNFSLIFVLISIFIASSFLALTSPAISATYEDYIKRIGIFRNSLIGIEQSASSISFIIFPPILGFFAHKYSNGYSFFVIGGLLIFIAIVSMIFTPKKINMPQKELFNL